MAVRIVEIDAATLVEVVDLPGPAARMRESAASNSASLTRKA
jgi:hypothetical protein